MQMIYAIINNPLCSLMQMIYAIITILITPYPQMRIYHKGFYQYSSALNCHKFADSNKHA